MGYRGYLLSGTQSGQASIPQYLLAFTGKSIRPCTATARRGEILFLFTAIASFFWVDEDLLAGIFKLEH